MLDTKQIAVTIPKIRQNKFLKNIYVEAGGVVSIEAEHYTDKFDVNGYEWKEERLRQKRKHNELILKRPQKQSDLTIQRHIWSTRFTSQMQVHAHWTFYRMPTLNERGTMRLAVATE